MGNSPSGEVLMAPHQREALSTVAGEVAVAPSDGLWGSMFGTVLREPIYLQAPTDVKTCLKRHSDRLVKHNLTTRHLNILMWHTGQRLTKLRSYSAAAQVTAVTNALYLCRTFTSALIGSVDVDELHRQLPFTPVEESEEADSAAVSAPPVTGDTESKRDDAAEPELSLTHFAKCLLDFVADAEASTELYSLHVEVLNMLITLLSPQLGETFVQETAQAGPPHHESWLYLIMQLGQRRAARVVTSLMRNFSKRLPAPSAAASVYDGCVEAVKAEALARRPEEKAEDDSLVVQAASLLLLPFQMYSYFFPAAVQVPLLADRSTALLLLLTHNCRSNGVDNPFRQHLCSFTDESATALSPDLSFSKLIKAFGECADTPPGATLLYTMLHGNKAFMDHVLSITDIDSIVVPLLRQLYNVKQLKTGLRYILGILLLLFTQSRSFSENVHKRVIIADVPWFKERILVNITLGSLIMVILCRTCVYNLARLHDEYLSTTCFCALANMAPHAEQLHSYASQRLVILLRLLHRKYLRASDRVVTLRGMTAEAKADVSEEDHQALMMEEEALTEAMEAHHQRITMMLSIISDCLSSRVVTHNMHLVYSLVHSREVLEDCKGFGEEALAYLDKVMQHFGGFVDSRIKGNPDHVWTEEGIMELLVTAGRSWRVPHEELRRKYEYDEEAKPEEFFVPFVWAVVVTATPDLLWLGPAIQLFDLADADLMAQAAVEGGGEVEAAAGSGEGAGEGVAGKVEDGAGAGDVEAGEGAPVAAPATAAAASDAAAAGVEQPGSAVGEAVHSAVEAAVQDAELPRPTSPPAPPASPAAAAVAPPSAPDAEEGGSR